MMRAIRRAAVAGCIALIAGAAYLHWGSPHPAQPQPSQQQNRPGGGPGFRRGGGNPNDSVPVLAVAVQRADVPVYIEGVGTAKALNTVTVLPQVDGKLIKVMFTEGQEVPRGFVLAKIDPVIYQAQYDQAVAKKAQDEATLADAKLDLERYIKLAATNAVQKQQVDTQKSLVDQLTAQVQGDQGGIDNAKATLGYTDVVAPIAGLTGIRQIDEGNIVHTTDTTGLVTITQIKPIAVLFSLPQQNLPALNKAMSQGRLAVQALAADGTTLLDDGEVVVINNQVDQTTGTVQLKGEFPNHDVQLWPGQFVNIRVLIDTLRHALVVPTAAVQLGPDGTFVYSLQDDSTVKLRPVTVRQQDDRQAVIASGLLGSESVVTTGFGRLADGSKVEVASAQDATPGAAASGAGDSPRQPRRRAGEAAKGDGQRVQNSTGSPSPP
jgi:multidrug efflux system membrane fusion protein